MNASKSKPAKRAAAALVGTVGAIAGLTVAASPASAYAVSCKGVPGTVHREYGYTAACSSFPKRQTDGSVYLKVMKKHKKVTYVFGKFTTGHLGNANASFVISDDAPLGRQVLHIAIDHKVTLVPTFIRR